MPCCKAEKYDGWCKNLSTPYKATDGEYCVFHAPKGRKGGVSLEEFNKRIFKEIDKAKGEDRECNLSGTIFEGNISFRQYNKDNPLPPINLAGATFCGEADFWHATFSGEANLLGATFSRKVYFLYATFSGKTKFLSVKFSGKAYFFRTIFSGEAYFSGATFSEKAKFSGAIFSGEANFSGTTFGREAYFFRTTFSGETNFLSSTFGGETKFSGATFSGETNFSGTTFGREAYFFRTTFSREVKFSGATFSEKLSLSGETFMGDVSLNNINIEEKAIFEGVTLKKASFIDTDVIKIDFINCEWSKRFGRDVLYDELSLFNKKDDKDKKETIKNIKKIESLYRKLKQKYKEEHNEPAVSNWHYGEKEMFRKGNHWRRFNPLSISNLYWLSSGYGERSVRAGIVLLILVLCMSLFLAIAGLVTPDNVKEVHGVSKINWLNHFDIKAVGPLIVNTFKYATFRRVPFFEPENVLGEFIKLLTQVLIPIQTTLLVFALNNRFRR